MNNLWIRTRTQIDSYFVTAGSPANIFLEQVITGNAVYEEVNAMIKSIAAGLAELHSVTSSYLKDPSVSFLQYPNNDEDVGIHNYWSPYKS